MATIHVNRAGTTLGTFSEQDVRDGLRSGRLQATDLGWREGMAAWQPLSQFPEFADVQPTGEGSATPPPPSTSTPAPESLPVTPATTASTSTAPRSGLPWDERRSRGFFNAFIETLTTVLTKPDSAFTAMRREGGFGEPLIYAVVGAGSGALVSFLFSFILQSMGWTFGGNRGFAQLAGMGIGSVLFIILLPIFLVLGLFITAAIIHVCLLLVGGAKQPFETTFRVLSFAQGSTGPIQMIPGCGGIIAGLWGIVLMCIGLSRAHEITTGRAVVAVLLPVILCCGLGFFGAIMIPALMHADFR